MRDEGMNTRHERDRIPELTPRPSNFPPPSTLMPSRQTGLNQGGAALHTHRHTRAWPII